MPDGFTVVVPGPAPKLNAIREDFWAKVIIGGPDECWPWTAYRDPKGYGRFVRPELTTTIASRLAYEFVFGPLPTGLLALHTCDRPPCCNPGHLYAGTPLDNTRDRRERKGPLKGRVLLGETHWMTTLTNEDARQIRALAADGLQSQVEIGRRFGVSQQVVNDIHRRRTWKHL